jgi:Rhodopirellula transposase DDE domain
MPRRLPKVSPKKIPETDAIFAQVNTVNRQADQDETVLRVSMDAKARVKIGAFSRGGTNRMEVKASDHDFKPKATLTPVGIFLPQWDDVFMYMVTSRVTADCLVDCLHRWWESVRQQFTHIKTLVINLDNGPENHSRRTQFMKRLLEFANQYGLTIRLAYYPPYHSKYNPVERCWGILENYWNGALLDSVEAVLRFATNMTYNSKHPVVELVTTTYETGAKLSENAMGLLETLIQRFPQLGKWFVDISPVSVPNWDV